MIFNNKYIKFLLIGSILLLSNYISFALDSIPDYEYITTKDAWLSSQNASGLEEFNGSKASIANAYFNKSNGDFINYFESNNSYNYGVNTETYYKISDIVTIYGRVNYSYFKGKNMGGSSLIDPYYNAFNLVEYTDTTRGNKIKETYNIAGGLSTKLTDRWTIGLKGNYTNVSYFKTRDLRHTNDLLNLELTGGLKYKFDNIHLGLNYYYHRSVESIAFNEYGTVDKQYYTLIDFGGYFGIAQPYSSTDSEGITRGNDPKPYFNEEHEVSLQVNLILNERLSFFSEISAKIGDGYFGERSTTTIVYTEHSSYGYNYSGILTLDNKTSLHQLKLNSSYFALENNLNDYHSGQDSITGKTIVYYDSQNKINNRNQLNLSVGYQGYFQIENNKPLWSVNANIKYRSSYLRSVYYDYLTIRKQQINQYSSSLSAYRNFYSERNTYRIIAEFSYGTGSGYAFKDEYYTTSTGDLVTKNTYANREFEYFTADRLSGNLGFRYSRLFNKNKTKLFGELHYNATKAFNTEHIGDYLGSVNFNIGCQF